VGWTAADYLFHMKVLVTAVQERLGAAVIVSTPHKWTRGTHQNPHTQPEMTSAIRAYAKRAGLALADIYAEYPRLGGDGIHPGNEGHARMVAAYLKALHGEAAPAAAAGAAAGQFRANGDGTVTDTATGLVWRRDADLLGKAVGRAEALAAVEKLSVDWRLPTDAELLGLCAGGAEGPALPAGHPFENVRRQYHTSSVGMKLKTGTFWQLVDMQYGVAYFPTARAGDKGYVWLVRGGE
jgi:hypothetical protein